MLTMLEKNARGVEKRGIVKKLKDGYAKEVNSTSNLFLR